MSSLSSSEREILKEELDIDENSLRRYAIDASNGMFDLWDSTHGTFWRSTVHRRSGTDAEDNDFFPTVSLRCVDALMSLIVDFPDWAPSAVRKRLLEEVLPRIVQRPHDGLKTSLNVKGDANPLNLFTLSLYIQAFARIGKLNALPAADANETWKKLDSAAKSLLGHTAFSDPDGDKTPVVHPFLLYHSCRALSSVMRLHRSDELDEQCGQLIGRIRSSVRESIDSLIARHRLASLNPSESVASAFCAATLSLALDDEDWPYVRASIELCFDSQDSNGCWPLGRIVREDNSFVNEKLEISTYEIAAVVSETLGRLAEEAHERLASGLGADGVERVIEAGRYVERSVVRLPRNSRPDVGWCTAHAYGEYEIQSWTCATVLQSLINLARLIEESDRQRILSKFAHVSPQDADWPSWRRWETYRVESEVDHKYRVLRYLHDKVVEPVLSSPRRLPNRDPSSVSVLLFGPPGTSKTSIVKAVADGLKWPVVLLSPGDFIEKGLEYIESQTRSVFERLMRLSRAVVIFDECDELFRDRAPSAETEQTRGITAFVTASMLPKLQELHDRGRVLFFVCTNNFDTIDPAIKRGGRIDHIIGIGPPDEEARSRIVDATIQELKSQPGWTAPTHFDASSKRLALKTERFTRPEIQRAVRLLARTAPWDSDAAAENQADNVAELLGKSLTIEESDYNRYKELNKKYSHALSEGVPGDA